MLIKFNSHIYPLSAIRRAVRDFTGVAGIVLTKQRSYYRVDFKDINLSQERPLKDEFANYVLGMAKKCL